LKDVASFLIKKKNLVMMPLPLLVILILARLVIAVQHTRVHTDSPFRIYSGWQLFSFLPV
jgi:hypothetical protein